MVLPSLRVLTQAGGKLSAALVGEFGLQCQQKEIFFYVMYGAAEATARMAYLPPSLVLHKPASIGIAIPGGELWLEDEARSVIAGPEVIGELVYRGSNVSLGYAQRAEDLMLGDERRGILRTGDLAKRDEDGAYYIVGRKSRFIKIFGNRVNLEDVEQLLRGSRIDCACAGIDDLMTIYVTDPAKIQNAVSFVQQVTGLPRLGLRAEFIKLIPRNEAGKILYSELPG
jgi:acyl-CoA synthetase (AMP-forming)/AMP-acid ligase II